MTRNGTLAIRGARIPIGETLERRDLLLHEGRIARVAPEVDAGAPTLDASGLVALPGAIDVHVHFREPGAPHKETWSSGSRAALAGGVTCVLDMPNTSPPTTSLEALDEKRALAERGSLVDFGFYFGLTEQNVEEALVAPRVAGLKIYLGSSTGGLLVTAEPVLERVFRDYRGPIVVHAEQESLIQERRPAFGPNPPATAHSEIRNADVAVAAVTRVLELAHRYGSRLHVAHASTGAEIELIEAARRRGVHVSCEVTPHHLLLDESLASAAAFGTRAKVNPPLRPATEVAALWAALERGAIDLVATDHAPHLLVEKDLPYDRAAAGLPSVELLLPLLLDCVAQGRLSLAQLVRLTAHAPARLFGIRHKGRLEPGYDADLVLVDLDLVRTVEDENVVSRCLWSPYAGRELQGWPVMSFVRGHLAFGPAGFDPSARGREVEFQRLP